MEDLLAAPAAGFFGLLRRSTREERNRQLVNNAACAIVCAWQRLDAGRKRTLVDRFGPLLIRAAEKAAASASSAARASAARFVGDVRDPVLHPLLPALIGDASTEVSGAAEAALGRVVHDLSSGAGHWDAGFVRQLHAIIAEMLGSYPSHRRDGVPRAAIGLLDPAALAYPRPHRRTALVRWFEDRDRPEHAAMRSLLKRDDAPAAAVRAWQWLNRESVAAAALDRWMRCRDVTEHEAALRLGHLAENPERARRMSLASVRERARAGAVSEGPVPHPGEAHLLGGAAARGLLRVLPRLKMSRTYAEMFHASCAEHPDASVRWATAARGRGKLDDLAADADPCVARAAALRAPAGQLAAAALGDSPHAEVRRWADEERCRRDPWANHASRGAVAAREMQGRDPRGFLAELRRRIGGGDPSQSIPAMLLARRMNLCPQLELELLGVLAGVSPERSGAHERGLATAAAALGDVPSESARQAVRACFTHPVPRVRCNAVEASWGWRGSAERADARESALRSAGDEHHRLRGAAVRWLWSAPGRDREALRERAILVLADMLGDGRPLHRLAGLWAAERVLLAADGDGTEGRGGVSGDVGGRVVALAAHDSEEALRERAARLQTRLRALQRARWRTRAATLAGEVMA